ncbi:competence protein ComQ [Desulfitobacterium sp. LBE]|uniref:polyprenyl synthetase family protein n=1 Tax=Desulfitobacterium sp. LBE TaxID=884086 RepID=UPI0011993C44|nr:polyprenyl synthetase family protein [Desulfitobacterium sp. LBE]TWH55973.1 competence protein ComQ [Desulfitobacterium sp. LBE]
MGLTADSISVEQQIAGGIERFLAESGSAGHLSGTVLEWLRAENKPGGKQYPWGNLLFAIGDVFGDSQETIVQVVVAMELYALAADIFDDIEDQDNDELPWRTIPAAQAINTANLILFLSFKALAAINDQARYRQANDIFQTMGITACHGQNQEFLYEEQDSITIDQYFDAIGKKSGALTAGACKFAGVLAGCDARLTPDLEKFGQKLGIISQIKNDLQDLFQVEAKSDLKLGKKTLPLVYLANILKENKEKTEELNQLCSPARRELLEFGPTETDRLRRFIIQEGAAHYCSVICAYFKQEAVEILDTMNITEEQKRKLSTLVEN